MVYGKKTTKSQPEGHTAALIWVQRSWASTEPNLGQNTTLPSTCCRLLDCTTYGTLQNVRTLGTPRTGSARLFDGLAWLTLTPPYFARDLRHCEARRKGLYDRQSLNNRQAGVNQGRRQGFRPGWAKFGGKRRKFFFVCPPWFSVCPPCHT